jgi:hypothetical protein
MVAGRKAPQSKAAIRGDNLHAEIERYLKTGDRALSSLALSGLHMVPDPGPDLLIERDLALRPLEPDPTNEEEAAAALARAPLTADGIPVLGRMDLIHGRGTNKGGSSIEDTIDPPGTVEVCDWKSTSSPDWIKRAVDLPNLIQMAGYGEWVFRVEPAASAVRLSHGYFVERGGPSRKVTLRVLREDVAKTWEHAEGVARRIRHAARETNPDNVDANLKACDRYGGCPHREICKARMHQALASFVGQTAADNMLGKHGAEAPGEFAMGLMERVKSGAAPTVGTSITPPREASVALSFDMLAPTTPAQQPPSGPTPEEIAAEQAKLLAEETAKREAAQLRQAAEKAAPLFQKLESYAAANNDLGGGELGHPGFSGEAAKLYFAAHKQPQTSDTVPGVGRLAGQVAATMADVEKVIAALDNYASQGAIKPATSATPALGGAPAGLLSNETPPVQTAPAAIVTVTTPPPPEAVAQIQAIQATVEAVAAPTEEPKKRKPRESKEKTPSAPSGTAFNLIVDATVEGVDAASFHPILDSLAHELAQLHGAPDLRFPLNNDSPFAYNKWEGALSACLLEKDVAPGWYYLYTRGNRIAEVAAAALRERCQKTGGAFVWGGR